MDPMQIRLGNLMEWAGIHTLDDLDTAAIGFLIRELQGRVPIMNFRVSPDEFRKWHEDNPEVVDVEYDARAQAIVLKATASVLHEAAIKSLRKSLRKGVRALNAYGDYGQYYFFSKAVNLHCNYAGNVKQADAGVWLGGSRRPCMVIEAGVNETLKKDIRAWLHGSRGKTCQVIGINIIEQNRPRTPSPYRTWGLSPQQLSTNNPDYLCERIFDWHERNNVPLIGDQFYFDMAVMGPGGESSQAAFKVPIPHPGWRVQRPDWSQRPLRVIVSNDMAIYDNPNNPTIELDMKTLTMDLTIAIALHLPKERARMMAWDYIMGRDLTRRRMGSTGRSRISGSL